MYRYRGILQKCHRNTFFIFHVARCCVIVKILETLLNFGKKLERKCSYMNFKTSTSLIGAISQLLSKVMNVSLVSESFILWVVCGVKHPCGGRAWVRPLSGCGTASHWRGLRGIWRVQLAPGPVFTSPCRSLRLSLAFLRPLLPSALPSSLCSAYYPSLSLFTCSLSCFIPADSFCLCNKNQSHLLRTARLQVWLSWFFLLVWNLNWICAF